MTEKERRPVTSGAAQQTTGQCVSSQTTYLARVTAIRRVARQLDVLLGIDPGPRIPEPYGEHGMSLGVPERERAGVAA